MKTKISFVTNSSSSNFILSKKRDLTDEELREIFLNLIKNIQQDIIEDYELDEEFLDETYGGANTFLKECIQHITWPGWRVDRRDPDWETLSIGGGPDDFEDPSYEQLLHLYHDHGDDDRFVVS